MSQGPLCPNLTKKVQKEVSKMANRKLSCAMPYRWFKCKLKPPKKPDLNLKPKLIIISTPVLIPRKRVHKKPRHTYAKPSRREPGRAKKQPSIYVPDTDDSDIESDNDTKDGDFIPEGITGKNINIFYYYICGNMLYICTEYLKTQ